MTIEEAQKLSDSELDGTLHGRTEYFFNDLDAEELSSFIYAMAALNAKEGHSLISRLLLRYYGKQLIKSLKETGFLTHFSGKGTIKNPYYVETRYGNGNFRDLHNLFYRKKYSSDYQKNCCYSNAYYLLNELKNDIGENLNAWVVSGVASVEQKPFLYCGVKIKNKEGEFFIDFDRDVIINYDLFCEVFRFEPKCCVNLETIKKDKIFDYPKLSGKVLYLLCMAYDDTIKKLKSGELLPDEEDEIGDECVNK